MIWAVIFVLMALVATGIVRLFQLGRREKRVDWGRTWLNVLDGINRLFCKRFHRLRVTLIPLPRHGPALVVANHVSGLDPLLLIASSQRPLRFMIAREQYERFGLQWLLRAVGCIPVERGGSPHRALAAARHALQRGEVVALFPQGRIHLDHEGTARLKPGVRHLAELTGAPVYPVRIDGVHGEGHTVTAVFRRSRAHLTVFPHLYYEQDDPERLLRELGELLHRPVHHWNPNNA